jgi:hypothetical protein
MSAYMSPAGEVSTQYAPERWYRTDTNSVSGWLMQQGRGAAAGILDNAESALEGDMNIIPMHPVMLIFDLAGLSGITVDLGADRVGATPFDLMAHDAIGEIIVGADVQGLASDLRVETWAGAGSETFEVARPLLEAGEDYYLTPNAAGGFPPIYDVHIRGENGSWVMLPEPLDIREPFGRLQEVDQLLRSTETPEGETLADWIRDPNKQGAVFDRIDDFHAVLDIPDERRRREALLALTAQIATGAHVVDPDALVEQLGVGDEIRALPGGNRIAPEAPAGGPLIP